MRYHDLLKYKVFFLCKIIFMVVVFGVTVFYNFQTLLDNPNTIVFKIFVLTVIAFMSYISIRFTAISFYELYDSMMLNRLVELNYSVNDSVYHKTNVCVRSNGSTAMSSFLRSKAVTTEHYTPLVDTALYKFSGHARIEGATLMVWFILNFLLLTISIQLWALLFLPIFILPILCYCLIDFPFYTKHVKKFIKNIDERSTILHPYSKNSVYSAQLRDCDLW